MLNDKELLAFVLGSAIIKVCKTKISQPELETFILEEAKQYATPERISAALNSALECSGAFFLLGDGCGAAAEITLSERGRLMLNLSTKKLAVAEVVGDNFTTLTEDEIKKIKDSSDSLPG